MTGGRRDTALRPRGFLSVLLPGILLLAWAGPGAAVEWGDVPDITIELQVKGGEEGYFAPGEGITFYLEADRDCYLVVYNIDARGRVALLYPEQPDYSARVDGDQRYRVPPRDASYELFLGRDAGVEYLVAVASERSIPVGRWFPNGMLASAEDIFWEEGLGDDGFSETGWVEEDPFLAMDLINERLVPLRRRDDGYGEKSVSLRVGMYAEEYGRSPYRVERVEIVHHYDPFLWDPFWSDPFWDPFYAGVSWHRSYYQPWYGYHVYYPDPFWDPYWVDWYGPWGSGWWVSARYGVNVHWWSRPQHTHYADCCTPAAYWGSRIKWKAYRYGIEGETVKQKGARAGELTFVPSSGVRPPNSPATRYRLEPTATRAVTTLRTPEAGVRTRPAGDSSRETARSVRVREGAADDRPRVDARRDSQTPRPADAQSRTPTSEVRGTEKRRSEPAVAPPPRTRDEQRTRSESRPAREETGAVKNRGGEESPPAQGNSPRRGVRQDSASGRGSTVGQLVSRAARTIAEAGRSRARREAESERSSGEGGGTAVRQERGSTPQGREARSGEGEKKTKKRG